MGTQRQPPLSTTVTSGCPSPGQDPEEVLRALLRVNPKDEPGEHGTGSKASQGARTLRLTDQRSGGGVGLRPCSGHLPGHPSQLTRVGAGPIVQCFS